MRNHTSHNGAELELHSDNLKDGAHSIPPTSRASVTEGDDLSASSPQHLELENEDNFEPGVRRPRALQAIFLRPLKRKAEYGVPACDLQLRSYGPRNVEFFADFALRAAYYLGLPAAGPIPLPRITERWTVPRSNFIFKKSQENFERITFRRLIQIKDANAEQVEIWLAFLRKHAYYGVGMKASVWQHEKLCVGKTMDVNLKNLRSSLEPAWAHFGRRKTLETSEKAYQMIKDEDFGSTEAPNVAAQ